MLSWIRLLGLPLVWHARTDHARRSFNPCCLGLGCSAGGSHCEREPATMGFNPCCLGLGCSAIEATWSAHGGLMVSILVVLDQAARLPRVRSLVWCSCEFQSLLSWIRLLGVRRTKLAASCSSVSILVVLDQAARRQTCTCGPLERRAFQSLLSWIRLLGQQWIARPRRDSRWRFNPCCLGSGCSALSSCARRG